MGLHSAKHTNMQRITGELAPNHAIIIHWAINKIDDQFISAPFKLNDSVSAPALGSRCSVLFEPDVILRGKQCRIITKLHVDIPITIVLIEPNN